jgi:SAM-dependent methyltransferase
VPHVAYHLAVTRPGRVLDLGIGFGLYGAVVRQWSDLGTWPAKTWLVGVEGFAAYRNPAWDLYNLVVVDSIENYLARASDLFDCILLTDVIEHFPKETGLAVVQGAQRLLERGGSLFVGTPALFCPQEAVYGNEFERHRSVWTAADFVALGFRVILDGAPDHWGNQMLLAQWRAPAA